MRYIATLIFLQLIQPAFSCDCIRHQNSSFKSQTKNFDIIVSGIINTDRSSGKTWFAIDKVLQGNVNYDSIYINTSGCSESFVEDSNIYHIIGFSQQTNSPALYSANKCITDVLIVEEGIVKSSKFNNLSVSKRKISALKTEMKVEEFEIRLVKWQ